MNDDNRNEFDIELSPEESAEIDRIMRETAQLDDAEVDYDAILKGVKRRAKKEGIVIFPSKREHGAVRRGVLRAALAGAAVAAAVIAVGFGALSLAKQAFPAPRGDSSVDAYVSEPVGANDTKAPAPTSAVISTEATETVNRSTAPAYTVVPETPEPDLTVDPFFTPLPTETAMRGGLTGYVLLDSFDTIPDEIREILPADLPPFMSSKGIEDPFLEAKAYGLAGDEEYLYVCRVMTRDEVELLEGEAPLGVGVAKYTVSDTGELHYVWRITEDVYLDVEFSGFDRLTAEELLLELAADETDAAA